jgi:hypothetical protein
MADLAALSCISFDLLLRALAPPAEGIGNIFLAPGQVCLGGV